jgi:hypothetical protein
MSASGLVLSALAASVPASLDPGPHIECETPSDPILCVHELEAQERAWRLAYLSSSTGCGL